MLRGFYTAASGMIAQQRYQESIANNVANDNTPGYKADQPTLRAFPELLMQQIGTRKLPTTENVHVPVNRSIGSLNTGAYVQETIPNFVQGDLKETGQGTDLALVYEGDQGDGSHVFFMLENEAGEVRYTKNGNFTVDGEGYLTTSEGYYVLDEASNPVQTNGIEFIVQNDGTIDVGGQSIPLGIAYTEDVNQLTKEGDVLFSGEAGPVPEGTMFSVRQGFLERSNVDTVRSMTEMMEAYRMFETNQRVLKAYDESMGKAVSEIGRLG